MTRRAFLATLPAGHLVLVVPRIDVLACTYPVTDKVGVAKIAEFFVSYYPARSRVHVCLQFNKFLGQSLGQRFKWIIRTLVTSLAARIGFHCVEWSGWTVDGIVIVAELSA